ncbi:MULTISPECIES: hypothetical protein [unclassified Streptomyces]|uniref:hypothetical protein n=1 Tax=unclassified Streptomyces TaxID=2593676 RepID=UPI001874B711|nr:MULTISPECIES: hypothetical protein [unclassified Streptomyces]
MTEPQRGFRLPQRRVRTEAAPEPVPPVLPWHVASVPVGPRAARRAREAMTVAGVAPGSVFADAVLPDLPSYDGSTTGNRKVTS